MTLKEKLKDFSFVAYIIVIVIMFLFANAIFFTILAKDSTLLIVFNQIDLNKINSTFFFITIIYLGVIGVDKLITPPEEFLKKIEEFKQNEENVKRFSRKKFVFWVWFLYMLYYILMFYFVNSYKLSEFIQIDITNMLTYFLIVAATFISVETISPYLRKVDIYKK